MTGGKGHANAKSFTWTLNVAIALSCAFASPGFAAAEPENPATQEINIPFDRGEKLTATGEAMVADLSKLVATHATGIDEIIISGHANRTGNEYRNLDVSLKRARKISSILQQAGVDAGKIQIMAYGSSSADPSVAARHPAQRRVMVQLKTAQAGTSSTDAKAARESSGDSLQASFINWKPVNGVVDPRAYLPATEFLAMDLMAKAVVNATKPGSYMILSMPLEGLEHKAGRDTFIRYHQVLRQIGLTRKNLVTRFDSRAEGIAVKIHVPASDPDLLQSAKNISTATNGSAAIRLSDLRPLARFAPFLAKNKTLWKKIEIINGGPRAEAVKSTLIQNGVPASKIKTRRGYLSRRVIVSVSGLEMPGDVQNILDEALQRTAH